MGILGKATSSCFAIGQSFLARWVLELGDIAADMGITSCAWEGSAVAVVDKFLVICFEVQGSAGPHIPQLNWSEAFVCVRACVRARARACVWCVCGR